MGAVVHLRVAFESGHEATLAFALVDAHRGATVRRKRRWRAVASWALTVACSWVCRAEVVRTSVVNRPVGLAGLGAARATLDVGADSVSLRLAVLGCAHSSVPRQLMRAGARERARRAMRLLALRSGVELPHGAWALIEAHVIGRT